MSAEYITLAHSIKSAKKEYFFFSIMFMSTILLLFQLTDFLKLHLLKLIHMQFYKTNIQIKIGVNEKRYYHGTKYSIFSEFLW